MEPTTGFEPATLCLQNRCSTTELRRLSDFILPELEFQVKTEKDF